MTRRGRSGGSSSFSLTWDNKWYSEAKIYDDYWIAEMAIPFKTIRFKENMDSWFVNFYRIDSEYAEKSTWAPIPRNLSIINIAFNKEVKWDEPLQNPGKNISLIPYTAVKTAKDYEDGTPTKTKLSVGGDAKIALTSALNLDLTINPDFSQVETDQQVTNLDRFEIFYPEQRQFFLENADLFASFGSRGARPFFSRRIGVARDTSTGTNIENPLYFGGRMSGNINNKWRIGLMTIQAAEENGIRPGLLAAQSYQESHWNPKAKSPTGVRGIMMLTQPVAKSLGVKSRLDARSNIFAGARYHAKMKAMFDDSVAEPDRTWMALAAYNVGRGHFRDAQGLARKLDKNPNLWIDMKEVLPLLADKAYYKDLKYGYARGNEPVQYVTRIRDYDDILAQQFLSREAGQDHRNGK